MVAILRISQSTIASSVLNVLAIMFVPIYACLISSALYSSVDKELSSVILPYDQYSISQGGLATMRRRWRNTVFTIWISSLILRTPYSESTTCAALTGALAHPIIAPLLPHYCPIITPWHPQQHELCAPHMHWGHWLLYHLVSGDCQLWWIHRSRTSENNGINWSHTMAWFLRVHGTILPLKILLPP